MSLFEAVDPWTLVFIIVIFGALIGTELLERRAPGVLAAAAGSPRRDAERSDGGHELIAVPAVEPSQSSTEEVRNETSEAEESVATPDDGSPAAAAQSDTGSDDVVVTEPAESRTTGAEETTREGSSTGSGSDTERSEEQTEQRDTRESERESESEDVTVVCEHCGREFDSAPARNGHLRWCRQDAADTTDARGERTEDRPTDVNTADADELGEPDEPDDSGFSFNVTLVDEPTSRRDERQGRDEAVPTDTDTTAEETGTGETERSWDRGHDDHQTGSRSAEGGTKRLTLPTSTVTAAHRYLRTGEFEAAVCSAYRSIRQALDEDDDLPDYETHREFYAACRETFGDTDNVAALGQLVTIYEEVYYANGADVDGAEVEALLDRLVESTHAPDETTTDETSQR